MQKILTTVLLNRLISQGFQYCLSRTIAVQGEDADLCIILVPVKDEPSIMDLPDTFDTYFDIGEEPQQMALGVHETLILVDLSEVDYCAEVSV